METNDEKGLGQGKPIKLRQGQPVKLTVDPGGFVTLIPGKGVTRVPVRVKGVVRIEQLVRLSERSESSDSKKR